MLVLLFPSLVDRQLFTETYSPVTEGIGHPRVGLLGWLSVLLTMSGMKKYVLKPSLCVRRCLHVHIRGVTK